MDQSPPVKDKFVEVPARGLIKGQIQIMQRLGAIGLVSFALMQCSPAFSQIIGQSTAAPAPERIVVDQNNVDVTTGALSLSTTELSIGSNSYGLTLSRFYNSGSGWRDSFSGMLEIQTYGPFNLNRTSTASWGNGTWVFQDNSVHSRSGDGATFGGDPSGGYELVLRDGTIVTYALLTPGYFTCSNNGESCVEYYFATSVTYPNGLVVTPHYRVFLGSVTWQIRLQSVTNNAGYQIKFAYQSNTISNDSSTWSPWWTLTGATAINNGVEYCNPTADSCSLSGNWPSVSYSNGSGTHTFTDSLNRATRYTYTSSEFRIKTAGSATDNVRYVEAFVWDYALKSYVRRMTSATSGSDTWTYVYGHNHPTNPTIRTITATNPQSQPTIYTSSFSEAESWTLKSIKDPLNRTTVFANPCGGFLDGYQYFNGSVYNSTSPEGDSVVRACDTRGNVTSTTIKAKPGSGLADIVATATFSPTCQNDKTCNKPSAVIDGRGAQSDYTYSPTHGGADTETLPAVNGVRPKKVHGYDQFYAYVRNAAGSLVQATSPVWLPTRISECRTSASCTGGADEVVTTFEYGAAGTVNRLLPRGKVVTSEGVSLRACYSYDPYGNQISVTTPRAGLSSCP